MNVSQMPVTIMFHSVGLDKLEWSYPQIAEPPGYFASKMRALKKGGYSTSFFAKGSNNLKLGAKQVVLTFDDGYLDNWVHVFPLLKEYELKATMFVTPDFVDPRPIVREQVDPHGKNDDTHDAGECCAGFLSWSELRAMEQSGLVDVQCHGLTHTWHYTGPNVVGFWHPGAATEKAGPVWMVWNRFPHRKPYYLTEAKHLETKIPYGTPIYEHGKALEVRRFFPDDYLDELLTQHVHHHGGRRFFDNPDWRSQLNTVVNRFNTTNVSSESGRAESNSDYESRVGIELARSKAIIEEKLDKSVEAICWPGGGVNDRVLEIARDTGYRYFTLPSKWRQAHGSGDYLGLVPRIGSRSRIHWHGRDLGRLTPQEFIWDIEAARDSLAYRLLRRGAIVARLGRSLFSGLPSSKE